MDPGLVKDGVEAHLQMLLAEHVAALGDGWSLVRREFPTPIGPVDLHVPGRRWLAAWPWRSSGAATSTASSS